MSEKNFTNATGNWIVSDTGELSYVGTVTVNGDLLAASGETRYIVDTSAGSNEPLLSNGYTAEVKMTTIGLETSLGPSPDLGKYDPPGFTWSNDMGDGIKERMRLDSWGNLLVGQTIASTTVNGAYIRTVGSGFIATSRDCLTLSRLGTDRTVVVYENDIKGIGSISIGGETTSYNTTSDQRLKENIVDAPAGNIDRIKVRSFDWKADGAHQEYGFIAQELETVAPYAVTKGETDEDMMSVDYSKLVPMLVKEIQDLKAEVSALITNIKEYNNGYN